jgi:hypothetical protein
MSSNNDNETLSETYTQFINQENVGKAQYNLVHQFQEHGFPEVPFALGTMQALYVGEFLFSDSSTPSTFTVFTFYEQELNSDDRQNDYLICHLLQVEG